MLRCAFAGLDNCVGHPQGESAWTAVHRYTGKVFGGSGLSPRIHWHQWLNLKYEYVVGDFADGRLQATAGGADGESAGRYETDQDYYSLRTHESVVEAFRVFWLLADEVRKVIFEIQWRN